MRNRELRFVCSIVVLILLALVAPGGVEHMKAGATPNGVPLYVDWEAGGANDGSSWDDAFVDLQLALEAALPGDEIWVAAGTYYPSVEVGGEGDRYRTFQMLNEVGIFGGFDPSAGDVGWADRDWVTNETMLSGDIGVPGDVADNCYHVFYHPSSLGLDGTAILDGFTVTGGRANGSGDHNSGGGMFNSSSSPTLTHCIFDANSAASYGGRGGGMANDNGSSPTLVDCTFTSNSADRGGAMSSYGYSAPTVTNCTFTGNSATDGGGMRNDFSSPAVTNSTFTGNSADHGGGMRNTHSSPTVTDSAFNGNTARIGGGMENCFASAVALTNCTFDGNSSGPYGFGGAIRNYRSSPTITNCTFSHNVSVGHGGAIENESSSPEITNSIFESNSASAGGAMFSYDSSPTVTNCTFVGNTAEDGGAIYYEGSVHTTASPRVINCTFSGNVASDSLGGAIDNYVHTRLRVTNCILWADSPGEIRGSDLYLDVTYSDVQGGYAGEGNIEADPLFVDPANGDYHLGEGSPCIDKGDNNAPKLPLYDFEGDDRIIDGDCPGAVVDMGVDEAPEAECWDLYPPLLMRNAP